MVLNIRQEDCFSLNTKFRVLQLALCFGRIRELGLAGEQYEWYLDLRRHGTVKHAGFSFGFDLMVLFATGSVDVRDVIPFPRTYGKVSN